MPVTLAFTVNGQPRTVSTEPRRPLLDVLREDLGLAGTKYGCGEGACGACSVMVEGEEVRSCLTPVADVAGKSITTIEGIADGDRLHPVQEALAEHGVLQCGYCAPGMVIAAAALLRETPRPTAAEIVEALDGHLCRCGTYPALVAAIQQAAGRLAEVNG